MTSAAKQQLIDAVRLRTEPHGYGVDETSDGFRVAHRLSDASWWGPAYQAKASFLIAHDVRLDEAERHLTITDEVREVHWKAGATPQPSWSGETTVIRGRIMSKGFRRSYGVRGDGVVGPVEDYAWDTDAGRAAISEAARDLGWKESWPWEAKVGLVFGIIGAVGALVTVVVLVTLALLGKF